MIVAAFEEWFQNTNGNMCKEFLFEDLWSRIAPSISKWETRGHQVCGLSEDGLICVFRDQLNRGIRYTRFKDDEYENLQYVEDVDSHDWCVYVTERSSRTSGFLRTQAWWRQGLRRTAFREYKDNPPVGEISAETIRRDIALTMAEEEGLRVETLETCSLDEIEERIGLAHMRPQLAVFGQD